MKDVTHMLDHYRCCVRTLWNNYFTGHQTFRADWDVSDEFEDICVQIFNTLVLNSIGKSQERKSPKYKELPTELSFFHVIPSVVKGVPIQINREKHKFTYWDHPLTLIRPGEADMRFVDFFNFNTAGLRDYEYCRVRIVASSIYSDIVGRNALLEYKDVTVLFDDAVPNAGKGQG